MKRHITYSCFLILLFCGIHTSLAQEASKSSEETMKQTILANESAKDQTFLLHKMVNLTADQIPKIHELFLELDKSKNKLKAIKEKKETKLIDEFEAMKTQRLKELLTEEQFEIYLKSFKKE